MPKGAGTNWGHYVLTVAGAWIAACAAAWLYARQQQLSWNLALAILPAFLVELAFYLAPGFAAVRKSLEGIQPVALRAGLLWSSAVAPYLLLVARLGGFRVEALALLAATAGAIVFWYVVARKGLIADCIFLAIAAGVYLSPAFREIYPTPARHAPLEILGRLMWIRTGILAALSIRGLEAGFGFWPTRAEWRTGLELYLFFLPVGGALALLLRFARFHPAPLVWWKFALVLAGTFAGLLWVVSLGEEFFFRGFLQQVISRAADNKAAGLILASLAFGAAHLPFRAFPNWKFAIVAAAAGVFMGLAFIRAGSVRASMVTHALVATTLRMFFAA